MDEEPKKSKHEPIDWFGVDTVMAFVTAFVCDALFLLVIPHYLGAFIAIPIVWPKTRGFLAKLMLVLAFVLPLPVLTIGIWLAIFLSNKVIALLAEQAGILLLAVGTGGAGLAAEAGVVGGTAAAEGAAAVTEAAAAATEVAAGATEAAAAAAGETAGAAAETAQAAKGAETVAEGARAAEGTQAAEGAEEAEGEARESLRDKVKRKLKEKIREKVREGLAGEEEEEEEPTEDEITAEMEKERELERALGEPPEPMEEVGAQIFGNVVPIRTSQTEAAEGDVDGHSARPARPPSPGSVVNIDERRKNGAKRADMADIRKELDKTEDIKRRWEGTRENNGENKPRKAA